MPTTDAEYNDQLWYLNNLLATAQANIRAYTDAELTKAQANINAFTFAELERFEVEYDKILARYHHGGTSTPPTEPPPTQPPSSGPIAAINLNWGNPPTDTRGTNASIGSGSATTVVGRLVVPLGALSPTNTPGVISVVEYDGSQAERVLSLSTQANDFRGWKPGLSVLPPTDPTGASYPIAWAIGINPNRQFLLSGDAGTEAKLTPGQIYYVNLATRRYSDWQPSCSAPSCNVRITVNPPR